MNKIAIITLSLLLLPFSAYTNQPQIIISVLERAPYYYIKNNQPRGFILEWQLDILKQARVPFTVRSSNSAKGILNRIQRNKNPICSPGWFKTKKREKFGQYSDIIYQNKPLVVLTRVGDTRFDSIRSIKKLFLNKGLSIAINESFSYGKHIDNLIEEIKPNLIKVDTSQKNLFRMLIKGRFDYMLSTPEEISSLILAEGLKLSDFSIRMMTDIPPGNKRYLLCSKKVSPKTIETINQAIQNSERPNL